MDFKFLSTTMMFRGITPEEVKSILSCLNARKIKYKKRNAIFRIGDITHEIGIILCGSISIENDDLWGNKTVLDQLGEGQVFAETYACIPNEPLMVNIISNEDTELLFLDINKIMHVCSNSCNHHVKLLSNLFAISARKNLNLSRRSFHTAPKSIRARLLSYLSYQAKVHGKYDFYIPFNRQQLADYLNVDRSALSNELGKMRDEGYLITDKNHFILSEQINL